MKKYYIEFKPESKIIPDFVELGMIKGVRVTYTNTGSGKKEKGIIKKVHPEGGKAWVVYNCGGDWENYEQYTGALTEYSLLTKGWENEIE